VLPANCQPEMKPCTKRPWMW